MADGRPSPLRDTKPVPQQGSSSADPSNPNSRQGRARSPLMQGRDKMDAVVVGIDVSKDRLDVAIRPSGEAFAVDRTTAGLGELTARLGPLAPKGHRDRSHRWIRNARRRLVRGRRPARCRGQPRPGARLRPCFGHAAFHNGYEDRRKSRKLLRRAASAAAPATPGNAAVQAYRIRHPAFGQ